MLLIFASIDVKSPKFSVKIAHSFAVKIQIASESAILKRCYLLSSYLGNDQLLILPIFDFIYLFFRR